MSSDSSISSSAASGGALGCGGVCCACATPALSASDAVASHVRRRPIPIGALFDGFGYAHNNGSSNRQCGAAKRQSMMPNKSKPRRRRCRPLAAALIAAAFATFAALTRLAVLAIPLLRTLLWLLVLLLWRRLWRDRRDQAKRPGTSGHMSKATSSLFIRSSRRCSSGTSAGASGPSGFAWIGWRLAPAKTALCHGFPAFDWELP